MSNETPTRISGYRFKPEHLEIAGRKPGISAFMRIKNGEQFLEPTIRSHINHVDEIVAVYNGCTDTTEAILVRLAKEYGPKLRLFHYADDVFPPGSTGHAKTDSSAPSSLVNYSNFALAQTRHTIATKLDDDHLGIEPALTKMVAYIRSPEFRQGELAAFSGLNLAPSRERSGDIEVLLEAPISGKGDIGFFHVTPTTYFVHDRRFERFNKQGISRRFHAFVYWHLKFLKDAFGFANYDLENNPDSRYARLKTRLETYSTLPLEKFRNQHSRTSLVERLAALAVDKRAIARDQRHALAAGAPHETIDEAIARLSGLYHTSASPFGEAVEQ